MEQLSIGQVAKHTGVTVETIRFYEKQGLIGKPARSSSGYRQYSPSAIGRIRFIQRAKDVGFTLKDIQELLQMRATSDMPCADVRDRAMGKIRDIEQKMNDLRRMRDALNHLAEQCSSVSSTSECPILDALEESELNES